MNHVETNLFKYEMNARGNKSCECGNTIETQEHLIMKCEQTREERMGMNEDMTNLWNIRGRSIDLMKYETILCGPKEIKDGKKILIKHQKILSKWIGRMIDRRKNGAP
eukprot:121881_1